MEPKFKTGDKIVCLYNDISNPSDMFYLELDKIYTVVYCDYERVRICNANPIRELFGYSPKRFLTLKDYRKLKLRKLCSK